MLICPVCKEKLIKENKTFRCVNNHSFDCAKQGYVNLSRKQTKNHGDNALMVKARTDFLEKDYYDFMRQYVKEKGKRKCVFGCWLRSRLLHKRDWCKLRTELWHRFK